LGWLGLSKYHLSLFMMVPHSHCSNHLKSQSGLSLMLEHWFGWVIGGLVSLALVNYLPVCCLFEWFSGGNYPFLKLLVIWPC
jgi:hypothetical protein